MTVEPIKKGTVPKTRISECVYLWNLVNADERPVRKEDDGFDGWNLTVVT